MPKIFYETGALGKESVSILVGKDPLEVAEQIYELARIYHRSGRILVATDGSENADRAASYI